MYTTKQFGRHAGSNRLIALIIVGVIVIGGGIAAATIIPRMNEERHDDTQNRPAATADTSSEQDGYSEPTGPACDGGPYFTVAPVPLEDLVSIFPLGNLNPSGHTFPSDHIYLTIPAGADVPVYAPGDVTVYEIVKYDNARSDPPYVDYTIRYIVCDGIDAYYIHVGDLSEKLQQAYDAAEDKNCDSYVTGGDQYDNCTARVDLAMTAGEEMASISRADQTVFDMGLYDKTIAAGTVANPERYEIVWSNYHYTQCPANYYTDELKAALLAKFSGWDGTQTGCGEVSHDVPGTAAGIWFLEGTPYDSKEGEDRHLSLVHLAGDATDEVLSIGISLENLGVPTNTYTFTPRHEGLVNREISEITPDGTVYCFDTTSGARSDASPQAKSLLLTLVDDDTLRLGPNSQSSCGSGPWSLGEYVTFER